MAFKMTVWTLVLMFFATIYNVVDAYSAMDDMNVQGKFQQIGLLDDGRLIAKSGYPLPPRKPLLASELASN